MSTPSLHTLHAGPRLRPTSTPHGVATVHFGELHGPVLDFIAGSEVIVGCVAWITSGQILDALASKRVALVVQKEGWWKRGDTRGAALARRYAALTGGLAASAFPEPLGTKTFRGKPVPNSAELAPIACVGYGYGSGSQFQPLMHHKFIVRCTLDEAGQLVPLAVWTGSANFSANSNDSMENALVIHDPAIAAAYLGEFALVASLSEPMNWRLSRPSPKGAGVAVFAPIPPKPKATTALVVTGAGKKRAAAKKATGRRPAAAGSTARKSAPKTTRTASVTRQQAQKKATTKKSAARTPRRKAA